MTVINGGTLEIGLDVANNATNWVGLDNVHLYYRGNSAEAYAAVNEVLDATEEDYKSDLENYTSAFEMSIYNRYDEAKKAFEAVRNTTGEEYATAFNNLILARQDMEKSIETYAPYLNRVEEGKEW